MVSNNLKSKKLLGHIYEISHLLTQLPDLDEVLNQITDHVISGLRYDRAVIMLLNEDKTKLECRCMRGFTPEGEKRAWEKPLDILKHDCYETKVIRSGKSLYIPDVYKTRTRMTKIDNIIASHHVRKSVLHVPLKVKDRVLGTIGVDRYKTKMKITQREVKDLAIFANQAAIIIENARLYKELKDEKLLADRIIKSSVNGIIVCDLKGKIVHVNPKAEELFGIEANEAVKLKISDIMNGDLVDVFPDYISSKSHYEIEYHKNDKKQILDIVVFPLRESAEIPANAVLLINDLTEQRRIDEHLVRVEKFAALGSMASAIAHEIRNPLAAIFTTVQNVEGKLNNGSPHKIALQNVTLELDRIERLIRELMTAMNPLPIHMEQVHIMDLLNRALFFVKKKTGDKNVKFELKGESVETKADSNRLMQVFLNILINSVDALKKSGKIIIKVNVIKDDYTQGKYFTIGFHDNGIGISPSILNKIFDPFFTTKSSGTGLGLTVSHKIIQDHNGFIQVDSRERGGTDVVVTLPLINDER